MAILLLVAAFIVVPLAELYVIIQVGQAIGLLPTILVLLADSILGSLLLRSQGRSVWRRFSEAVQAGRIPHREALDGALVIFGGALLLTPGFLTDVVGLLLLIPPTRSWARRLVLVVLKRRVTVAVADGRSARREPASRRPFDVEGTATEASATGDGPAPRLER